MLIFTSSSGRGRFGLAFFGLCSPPAPSSSAASSAPVTPSPSCLRGDTATSTGWLSCHCRVPCDSGARAHHWSLPKLLCCLNLPAFSGSLAAGALGGGLAAQLGLPETKRSPGDLQPFNSSLNESTEQQRGRKKPQHCSKCSTAWQPGATGGVLQEVSTLHPQTDLRALTNGQALISAICLTASQQQKRKWHRKIYPDKSRRLSWRSCCSSCTHECLLYLIGCISISQHEMQNKFSIFL